MRNIWGQPTDWETVCRRNAGRRRYNAQRRLRREFRQREVARLLMEYSRQDGQPSRGHQARIARELGVSRGTISRDIRGIKARWIDALIGENGDLERAGRPGARARVIDELRSKRR